MDSGTRERSCGAYSVGCAGMDGHWPPAEGVYRKPELYALLGCLIKRLTDVTHVLSGGDPSMPKSYLSLEGNNYD